MNQSLQDHCDRLAKTNAEQYAELREARDALAAKDAEIERLRELFRLDGEQHAATIKAMTEQHEIRVRKYYEAKQAAIATERERCARVADEMARGAYTERAAENAQHIADAIRAG